MCMYTTFSYVYAACALIYAPCMLNQVADLKENSTPMNIPRISKSRGEGGGGRESERAREKGAHMEHI